MAGTAQAAADDDAAGVVAGEARFGEEGGGDDAGGPQHLVGSQERAVRQGQAARRERPGLNAAGQLDASFDQRRAGGGAGADGRGWEWFGFIAYQRETEPASEPMCQRQRELG